MRHEYFLERYERLDNGDRLSVFACIHKATCAECKAAAKSMDHAIAAYREPYTFPLGRIDPLLLDERIMNAVRLLPRPRHLVSTRDWVTAGVVIALSTVLVPLGDGFAFIKEFFGARYTLPLALVLGLSITAYGAMFIGTHIEELSLLLRRGDASHRKA